MQPGTAEGYYHTGKPHRVAKPHQRGLTLIELLVAIAVLAIMVTWAIPGFQGLSARNAVAGEVMRIKTALAMARNTAITRRTTITVCPSADHTHCTNDDWTDTLVVIAGRAEDGTIDGPILRVLDGSRVLSVTYRGDNRPVRYGKLGRSIGHNGTFRICGRDDTGAQVIVSNFGRVRVDSESPACKSQ